MTFKNKTFAANLLSFSFYYQYYKGNKGRCKESTIRGHRKKSEPQMGFEPTTLSVLDHVDRSVSLK